MGPKDTTVRVSDMFRVLVHAQGARNYGSGNDGLRSGKNYAAAATAWRRVPRPAGVERVFAGWGRPIPLTQ